MKIKQRPEDFVVREGFRFEEDPEGPVFVYRMDKQKVSTLQALERIGKEFGVRRRDLSVCGLKDKQGRTEQLVGVQGGALAGREVLQTGDLRLKLVGRAREPLSSANITSNRFEVTVRDLSREEAERVPESVREVERVGVVNYFDSQRFGFVKHGQGFLAKHLLRGDFESALKALIATPSELDRSDDAKVKAFWREHWGEWQLRAPHDAAKRYAPILRRLREDPRDFQGAFLHVDRRLRMMAVFELQSFVWNEGVRRYLLSRVPAAELIGLRYQAGALLFPRALPGALRDELWSKTFPLLAPDSEIADAAVRDAALPALRAQGLRLQDLRIEGAPVFFKHEERPLFVRPGKLRVHDPRADELNRGRLKINLSFTLPPGAYATLVVRRVLWYAVDGSRPMGANAALGVRPTHRRDRRAPGTQSMTPGPLEPPMPITVRGTQRSGPGTAPQKRRPDGFLAGQRARKALRAARRATAEPRGPPRTRR
ncbi:MAG: tRNA pseudouridine(13) synthase TruD [Myxococcales bacterium]